ncbi:MAG TPA: hypothetical protein VGM51_04710 [Armatimonadota bacterium]|jgi:hypothetical protein
MQHSEPSAVERSLAMYRRLLRAYPPAFREQYGDEMARAFRDAARAAWQWAGTAGLIGLWARTLSDTLVNATQERVFGRRKGLTATAWELIVNWVHREVGPVPLAFLAAVIVLDLTRAWFPNNAPPDRGWALLIESALLGLVAHVVLKLIDATRSWTNSIITAGIIAWVFWLCMSKELGLAGLWARTLPWVALVCWATVKFGRMLSTEHAKWTSSACIAVPALVLLLISPAPHLATNAFLGFVVVVNGVAAVLSRIELKALEGDAGPK